MVRLLAMRIRLSVSDTPHRELRLSDAGVQMIPRRQRYIVRCDGPPRACRQAPRVACRRPRKMAIGTRTCRQQCPGCRRSVRACWAMPCLHLECLLISGRRSDIKAFLEAGGATLLEV